MVVNLDKNDLPQRRRSPRLLCWSKSRRDAGPISVHERSSRASFSRFQTEGDAGQETKS